MTEQKPSPSDPTPQRRIGDASMRPVVIAFFVTVLVVLVVAIILFKMRPPKVVPKTTDTRPTSHLNAPAVPMMNPLQLRIPA